MRVIVTGASGRLGRSVATSLAERGHEVISVDRHAHAESPFEHHALDLADGQATARVFAHVAADAVVHLAAIAVPFSAPEQMIFATNTAIAYSVLEASVRSGVRAVLAASSPTIMGYGAPNGWTPDYLPLDEDHPVAPWNGYAASKQSIENLVAMAVREFDPAIAFGVFRPCYVISPEEWAGAPTQQGHTVRERLEHPELSAVALFNYIDARDAGDFVCTWLERAHDVPNGSVFFVGADDALAVESTPAVVARHLPHLAERAAGLDDTSPLFSSAKARELLGWRPRRSWRTELA